MTAAAPATAAELTSTAARRRTLCLRLILLLVALGLTCRLAQYVAARSFWQDEAYVILNLRAKSPAQLFGALDARPHTPQAAPPAFLMIEKFAFDRFGARELPLRFLAQALGLVSLPLFARLAWQLLGPHPAAVLAVALFALSDELIAHASEVKQYSGDAFFAVLLLWLATRERAMSGDRRLWAVALAAAVCVWFSYPTLFVAAGIAAALFVARRSRSARDVAVFALAHVPLLVSAAALYLVCVRYQQAANLYDQWRDHLADWSAPLNVPLFIAVQTFGVIDYAAANAGAVTLPLVVVGAVVLWRMKLLGRPTAIMLLAPIALCLLAALIGRYPYGGARTSAFLAAPVCLLAGAGFGALLAMPNQFARVVGSALGGVAVAILLFQTGRALVIPRTRSHLRPVVEYHVSHRHPGDHVWVVGGAPSDIYRCYVDPVDDLTRLEVDREDPLPPLPPGRIWLIFAGVPDRLDKTIAPRLADARKVADERDRVVVRGAAAYLFATRQATSRPAGTPPTGNSRP